MIDSNGRPCTTEDGWLDDKLITEHSREEQEEVFHWIQNNLIPKKTTLYLITSYGLKHLLEEDTGIYLTNNEFKDAMLHCGYEPVNPKALNWNYGLSKKSPAFRRLPKY